MFRPVCSRHQNVKENKNKIKDKMFATARDVCHLKPLQIHCYKIYIK